MNICENAHYLQLSRTMYKKIIIDNQSTQFYSIDLIIKKLNCFGIQGIVYTGTTVSNGSYPYEFSALAVQTGSLLRSIFYIIFISKNINHFEVIYH